MKKSEEKALKKYPREDDTWDETNMSKRIGFQAGYICATDDFLEYAQKFFMYYSGFNLIDESLKEKMLTDFKGGLEL